MRQRRRLVRKGDTPGRPAQLDFCRLRRWRPPRRRIYTLIATAKLTGTDSLAWMADVLARLRDQLANRIDELLLWNWWQQQDQRAAT